MKDLVRGLADHPQALIATLSGVTIGIIALLALGSQPSGDIGEARFLVNLFKFFVGIYCIAISLYLYYGPVLNAAGIATRITPSGQSPTESVILYFTLGVAAILTSLAIVRPGLAHVLFWRMAGYSILFAVATGYFVLLMERAYSEEYHD